MSSGVAWVWMTEDAVASDELRHGHPRRAPGIADSSDELQCGVRHGGCGRGNELRDMGVHDGGRGRRRRAPTRPPPTSPRHRGLRQRASAWHEARTAEDVAAATSPAWGVTVKDAAASDVVAGLLPGAPAPQLTPTSGSIRVAGRAPTPSWALSGRRLRRQPSIPQRIQAFILSICCFGGAKRQDGDLIHRKHHPPRGENRMIPDRYHLIPHKYHLIRGRIA
uniref:Uncharacterized protein n=1 Tax=Oryza meridionalis TaxID=40149 RepID=A0A0E0CRE0_9ORYZ